MLTNNEKQIYFLGAVRGNANKTLYQKEKDKSVFMIVFTPNLLTFILSHYSLLFFKFEDNLLLVPGAIVIFSC